MPMNPRLLRPTSSTLDADAAVYLNAVAQADGQQLEPAVRKAINDFVAGCKRDNIWNAIKASCILAGARTLSGALIPLKGSAPTNTGPFVSSDYARGGATPGLIGNGSNKDLRTGRNNNADPQDNRHLSVYLTADSSNVGGLIGTSSTTSGPSWLFRNASATENITSRLSQSSSIAFGSLSAGALLGFVGNSRSDNAQITTRINGTSTLSDAASTTPLNDGLLVFRAAGAQWTNARIAFYSVGESVDLALLDSRLSTLMTAIGNAIP